MSDSHGNDALPDGPEVPGGVDACDVDAAWVRLVAAELARSEPIAGSLADVSDGQDIFADFGFDVLYPDAAPDSLEVDDPGADDSGADGPGLNDADPDGPGRNGPDPDDPDTLNELRRPGKPVPGVDRSGVAGMTPGTQLAAILDAVSPVELGVHELADVVAAWEQMVAWCAAKQAEAAAELTHRRELRPDDGGGQFASLHPVPATAAALCAVRPWTKPQAEKLVDQSVVLVEKYPAVHKALLEGRLDVAKARILTRALAKCDSEVAKLIEKAVLPFVHTWTEVKLSRVVNELLHELDAAGAKRRRREARDRRDVWLEPGEDGMSWLIAYLPAEEATAVMAAIKAAAESAGAGNGAGQDSARSADGAACDGAACDGAACDGAACDGAACDGAASGGAACDGAASGGAACDGATDRSRTRQGPRTKGQRRADALASFGWLSLASGHLGGRECTACGASAGTRLAKAHGRPVTVNVTVPMSTLLGLDEHPAYLDGYGPIDADVARSLAAAGVWTWVGTAPAGGHAIDYGTTRYEPPQALVDFVILRDRECLMPGCHRPAQRCEIDHRRPWPYGPTSACNCSALCKPCHVQKHRAGWTVEHLGDGRQRWTSPIGHSSVICFPRIAPDAPDVATSRRDRGYESTKTPPAGSGDPPF